jgi:endoglucanase
MLFFLGLSLTVFSWATPVQSHGQLKVLSGQIVDKNNVPPQLRGMSMFWDTPGWGGDRFYNAGAVSTLANSWKVDVVRAAIGGMDLTRTQNMIDWAISSGVYIIIDNHSHNAHLNTAAVKSYFQSVSNYVKGKGYPANVIYEIYNEPLYANGSNSSNGYTTWATIKTFAEQVIPAIRANDPNNLIIVGTPQWSQDISSAQANPITQWINIAYALHFYASDDAHQGLVARMKYSHCQGLPIFITEWGTPNADGNGTINWSRVNTFMSMVESLKLSWANWSMIDKPETSAALNGGGSDSGPWSLTTSGTWVNDAIIKLGQGTTKSGISSSSVDCSIQTSSSSRSGSGSVGDAIQAENYLTAAGTAEIAGQGGSGGKFMGEISDGATLTYTFQVATAGVYNLWLSLGSLSSSNQVSYTIGAASGSIPVVSTGGMTKFVDHKTHMALEAGTFTLSLTFSGTANQVNFDALAFSVPDSLDTLAYGLNLPQGSLSRGKPATMALAWQGANLTLGNSARDPIQSVDVYSLGGTLLLRRNAPVLGTDVALYGSELPDQGIILLVVKTRSNLYSFKVPIVP